MTSFRFYKQESRPSSGRGHEATRFCVLNPLSLSYISPLFLYLDAEEFIFGEPHLDLEMKFSLTENTPKPVAQIISIIWINEGK